MKKAIDHLSRLHPVALAGLAVFLFSTSAPMVAGTDVSGPVFAFWRLWLGVGIFGSALLIRRRVSPEPVQPSNWRWAVFGGLWFGTHHLLFVSAIKATSVVDVSLINRLSPILVGIVAIRLFAERPGSGFVAGAAVGIGGAGIVVLSGSRGTEGDPVGMILAIGTMATYAGFLIVSKLGRSHIDILPFLFGTMATAAVMITGFTVVTQQEVGSVEATDLLLIAGVAAIPGGLGHIAMTWSLKWVPVNIPPVLMLGVPIISGALAWVLLGESVDAAQLIGGVITLLGVALAILSPAGRRLIAQAQPNTPAN